MGILQSVMRYASSESEADEQLNNDRSNPNNTLASPHQFHNGNYLTIAVPNFRNSSSLAHTTVNTSSPEFTQITPHNVSRRRRRRAAAAAFDAEEGRVGSQREEAAVTIKRTSEGRWIKHYSSLHRILLVGEGDFSFAACLAATFGWATNMVATSLDSEAFLVKNYCNALSNIVELGIRKCKVMHEIDATKMANHPILGQIKFDRIVFNFPFAGFFKDMSRDSQLKLHRRLVSRYLKNAKEMISENGEIHITHKTNGFHMEWKIESIGSSHKLRLIEAVDFDHVEYAGYNNKCGFGGDNNFNCYPSKTYKFGV